jgi:hypothetical protein
MDEWLRQRLVLDGIDHDDESYSDDGDFEEGEENEEPAPEHASDEEGALSLPSSSLSSPEQAGNPLLNLERMLGQIRDVRRETMAAVERLAPHMPELVAMVEGLEIEAARHQASFDQLAAGVTGATGATAQPTGQRRRRSRGGRALRQHRCLVAVWSPCRGCRHL